MRIVFPSGWIGLALLFAGARWCCASPPATWQELRDRQPPEFHLVLVLSKDHFFQGEAIDATVKFSSDSPTHRINTVDSPGADFYALNEKGDYCANPRQYLTAFIPMFSYMMGSPVSLSPQVNPSVRFSQPGTYTLYAQASVNTRAKTGWADDGDIQDILVSDRTTITILPLTEEREKAAIASALQKIKGPDPTTKVYDPEKGVTALEYLQTPAAGDALISVLGMPKVNHMAARALLSAPDPSAMADKILAAVKAGTLVPDAEFANTYGQMSTWAFIQTIQMADRSTAKMESDASRAAQISAEAARKLFDAAKAASTGRGKNYVEILWAAWQANIWSNDAGLEDLKAKARAELAPHQLELPADHVRDLFENWIKWGGVDFLPLIEREARAGDPTALVILAGLKPDEARPLLVEELKKPQSRFYTYACPEPRLFFEFRPLPLPELDVVFRRKLAETKVEIGHHPIKRAAPDRTENYPGAILPLVECFGSPALLPDMVDCYRAYQAAYQAEPRFRGSHDGYQGIFLYWLRCDPGAATDELRKVLRVGAQGWLDPGFLSTLGYPWADTGELAHWALGTGDTMLFCEGMSLLEKQGLASSIDLALNSLEHFQKSEGAYKTRMAAYQAKEMLKSKNWHYTDEQKERLERLAAAK